MTNEHKGSQSIKPGAPPSILSWASVVGKKEGEGPLGSCFDIVGQDTHFGMSSWEKAESEMQKLALNKAIDKAGLSSGAIEYVFAGDLLNQCISTSFGLRDLEIPFFGLYGACSTMAESISLAAILLSGGFAFTAAALTSSHYASAERQYRLPLEYGGQRTPTAQWTVTGSGAVILSAEGAGPFITGITTGKITDLGVTDANNMGAAMAPAAYSTIKAHFDDFGRTPADYDLIVTGDLGTVGSEILIDFFSRDGVDIAPVYKDCGVMIYDEKEQDVHAGGSGCGCSAVVLTGYILDRMKRGELNRVLFAGTGALLSPTSTQQGESIPSICHAIAISSQRS